MIYFVLCPSSQGATLLSLLLNNHSRLFSLGDTNPTRTFEQGCSCGHLISQCEFWQGVRKKASTDRFELHETLLPSYPRFFSQRLMNQILNLAITQLPARPMGPVMRRLKPVRDFADSYTRFMEFCNSVEPFSHFIDGEKSILKYRASCFLGFEVGGAIHLVRDPRAFVNSMIKYEPQKYNVVTAAKLWKKHHKRILKFAGGRRYQSVVYEKLVADPEAEMGRLFEFMGVADEHIRASPNNPAKHHLIGNKMLSTFDGTINLDESWRETLSEADQIAIRKVTEPLFSEFGYR